MSVTMHIHQEAPEIMILMVLIQDPGGSVQNKTVQLGQATEKSRGLLSDVCASMDLLVSFSQAYR